MSSRNCWEALQALCTHSVQKKKKRLVLDWQSKIEIFQHEDGGIWRAQPGNICSNKPFCLFQLSLCLLPSDTGVRFQGGKLTKPIRLSSSDIKPLLEGEFWSLDTPQVTRMTPCPPSLTDGIPQLPEMLEARREFVGRAESVSASSSSALRLDSSHLLLVILIYCWE